MEEESSGGEEEPGDIHEWGAGEEEAGFPDSPVWWEVVGGARKQGPGPGAEEGGLHGSLWMEELEADLSSAGEEEEEAAEEEALRHGKGAEGVLGVERNHTKSALTVAPAHSLRVLPHTGRGGAYQCTWACSHLASSARSSPPPPLPSSR